MHSDPQFNRRLGRGPGPGPGPTPHAWMHVPAGRGRAALHAAGPSFPGAQHRASVRPQSAPASLRSQKDLPVRERFTIGGVSVGRETPISRPDSEVLMKGGSKDLFGTEKFLSGFSIDRDSHFDSVIALPVDPLENTLKKLENRLRFVRIVFTLLSVSVMLDTIVVATFLKVPFVKQYLQDHVIYYALGYVLFFGVYIPLVCFEVLRRRMPFNIIMLILLAVTKAYMMGAMAAYHDLEPVLFVTTGTFMVTITVIGFATCTKWDVSGHGVYMGIGSLIVAVGIIIVFIFCGLVTCSDHGRLLNLSLSICFVLIFAMYLLTDTRLVMAGDHVELRPNEYVAGALWLWSDIANLYMSLLYVTAVVSISPRR